MPASEARILANRANSARSTGPKTAEGKERSRANGLKHGLTGRGVVVPPEDHEEVELRAAALGAELGPKSTLGQIMVRRMATLSVRMERASEQESAVTASRARHSTEAFDEERLDEADRLFDGLVDNLRSHLRKLLRSPEGVDRILFGWEDLRVRLIQPGSTFAEAHFAQVASLLGMKVEDALIAPIGALWRAIGGDFSALSVQEGGDLDGEARKLWARGRMVELIAEEVEWLAAHRETLDFETIEQDRAGAAARSFFDPSREATLARRYESEASRGFFKALKEFRQAETDLVEQAAMAPAPSEIAAPAASPEVDRPREPLASCREGFSRAAREPQPAPTVPSIPQYRPSIGVEEPLPRASHAVPMGG